MNPAGLNQAEAAEYVGMSVKTFRIHVRPYVKRVEIGRRMIFPRVELERWLDKNASSI